MTAVDLLEGLRRAGTGHAKLNRGRRWMEQGGRNDGRELVNYMIQESLKAVPDDPWPQGTIDKAGLILAGAFDFSKNQGEALPPSDPGSVGKPVAVAVPRYEGPKTISVAGETVRTSGVAEEEVQAASSDHDYSLTPRAKRK